MEKKEKRKLVAHTINFDEQTWNIINDVAQKYGLSFSAALRLLLREYEELISERDDLIKKGEKSK